MNRFLPNKYTNWYISIVDRAKTRQYKVQGEKHHIIPKSMGGSETVLLTYKEHFICHCLLIRMVPKGSIDYFKMICALSYMRGKSKYHGNRYVSNLYELHRKYFIEAQSQLMAGKQSGEKNSQFGRPRSEATKLKISNALKLRQVVKTGRPRKKCLTCAKNLDRRTKGSYCKDHTVPVFTMETKSKLSLVRRQYLASLSYEAKQKWSKTANSTKYGLVSVNSPKIE